MIAEFESGGVAVTTDNTTCKMGQTVHTLKVQQQGSTDHSKRHVVKENTGYNYCHYLYMYRSISLYYRAFVNNTDGSDSLLCETEKDKEAITKLHDRSAGVL